MADTRRDFLKFAAGTSLAAIIPGLGEPKKVVLASTMEVERFSNSRGFDKGMIGKRRTLLLKSELLWADDSGQNHTILLHTLDAFHGASQIFAPGEEIVCGDKRLCGYEFIPHFRENRR